MKDKILPTIIGMLIGAIIATTGFLIYEKMNTNKGMPNGERPSMMENWDGENPPERPDGERGNRQMKNSNTSSTSSDSI